MNQKVWGCGPAVGVFGSPVGDSDARQSLKSPVQLEIQTEPHPSSRLVAVADLKVYKFVNCGESSICSMHKKQTEPVYIYKEKNGDKRTCGANETDPEGRATLGGWCLFRSWLLPPEGDFNPLVRFCGKVCTPPDPFKLTQVGFYYLL